MPAISSIAVMRFVIAPYVFPLTPPVHYVRPNSGLYVSWVNFISPVASSKPLNLLKKQQWFGKDNYKLSFYTAYST
jgi:hypothetical protein